MTAGSSSPTVVLVHGAFADASGFGGVVRELQGDGIAVLAPPNPLRGIAFDADTVGAFVAAIDGPVVLAGHSYGGAVIGQAAATLDNVVGLVFLAAYSLEVDETRGPGRRHVRHPSAAGRRGVRREVHGRGWRGKPVHYLVSARDNAISPDCERFMGERMGGTVETIDASHVAFISRPVEVAAFIRSALP